MKIAICDDERDYLNKICKQVEYIMIKNNWECEIATLYDAKQLTNHFMENDVDILLLDVDMPGKSGFDILPELEDIQPKLKTIFVSSHEELALQSYDYQPYWFVSKNNPKKLNHVLAKLVRAIKDEKSKNDKNNIVYLKLGKDVPINVYEVIYLKSNAHYIDVYSKDGIISTFRATLSDVYDTLSEHGFIFAHRSYIVNCRYISEFNSTGITLKNGERLTVSRNNEIINEAHRIYSEFTRRLRW